MQVYWVTDPAIQKKSPVSLRKTCDNGVIKKMIVKSILGFAVLYDGEEEQKELTTREKYDVSGIPHFILIDKDGKVSNIWIGYSLDVEELITAAIEKQIV